MIIWPDMFSILILLAALAMFTSWFYLYSGQPVWLTINEQGIHVPFVATATIPWEKINSISAYNVWLVEVSDSGLRFRIDRSVRIDNVIMRTWVWIVTFGRKDKVLRFSTGLLDVPPLADLAKALERIRIAQPSDRLKEIQHLQASVSSQR